jgi:erythromycin esterase-like protein
MKIITVLLFLLNTPFLFSQKVNPIRTINSADTNFSDLSFLSTVLKENRIVGLGEQSHRDGASFDAKVRLIKYLHEELNYNIIAFESGLYDCSKADELITNRKTGNDTNYLFQAIFRIWETKEVNQLAAYINETKKTKNPLILTGFDCQFAGVLAKKYLAIDFNQMIDSIEVSANIKLGIDRAQLNKSLFYLAKYSNYYKKLSNRDTTFLNTTITTLFTTIAKYKINNERIDYWKQIMRSIMADYRGKYMTSDRGSSFRDSTMAENIFWLSGKKFKGEKIILWAHNIHLIKDTKSIVYGYERDRRTTGEYLKKKYPQDYYFIAFTSYRGTAFRVLGINFKVGEPKEKSVEQFFQQKKLPFSFLDLRDLREKNNPYFFNSKIKNHAPLEMNLYKMVDGIFYIEKMYPATRKY